MLIYRVENAVGAGPYNSGLQWHPDRGHEHPGPYQDHVLAGFWGSLWNARLCEKYSFGFASERALNEWFHSTHWREYAESQGYVIAVYEIDPEATIDGFLIVLPGDKQLVFRRDCARRYTTISLTQLPQAAAAPGRHTELSA